MSLKPDGALIGNNMNYCKVTVFVPLEFIGIVRGAFDGICY